MTTQLLRWQNCGAAMGTLLFLAAKMMMDYCGLHGTTHHPSPPHFVQQETNVINEKARITGTHNINFPIICDLNFPTKRAGKQTRTAQHHSFVAYPLFSGLITYKQHQTTEKRGWKTSLVYMQRFLDKNKQLPTTIHLYRVHGVRPRPLPIRQNIT